MPTGTRRERREPGADPGAWPIESNHIAVSFDRDALSDALLALVESPDYRPPVLPPIALELVSIATRLDVTLEEIVPIVERDGWFAARLRAAADREARATGIKLGSMRQVCLYFGMLKIRDLAIEQAVGECVFRSEAHQGAMDRLRRHALATAHLARAIAESTTIAGEYAYVTGLVHDVGIAGVLHVLAERSGDFGALPPLPVLWPAIERIHGRVGAIMARRFGFPPAVEHALEAHHDLPFGRDASPLAAVIAIASELAHHEGFGLADDSPSVESTELLPKEDGAPVDRASAHVLDRPLSLLDLEPSGLHLIAHRAKRALREIDEASELG